MNCSEQENNDIDQPSDSATQTNTRHRTDNHSDQSADTASNEAARLLGESIYQQQCLSCHGETGQLPVSSPLQNCSRCQDRAQLSDYIHEFMPPAQPFSLAGDELAAITEYVLSEFNQSETDTDNNNTASAVNVRTISTKEAAYRLAFDVANKVPSQQEIELFTADRAQQLDHWLNSEAFYSRLMTFYNQKLHTDRYHSRFKREAGYQSAVT